jgi:sterol desaturase/sphingolipid hydroxylase (fatty acid hydroxylase superfamily)
MQLSKFSYYADFVVYPVVIVTLAAIAIDRSTWANGAEWLGAGLAGMVLWTLMEYALHRVALHRMRYFSPMHDLHHAAPLDLIGTPSWISVSVLSLGILLPVRFFFGFIVADGLTVGVMFGYWWYGVVHHVIHHRAHTSAPTYFDGLFDKLRAWHMRHHYSPKRGNFGVTTPFWDYVFGTAIGVRDKAVVSS